MADEFDAKLRAAGVKAGNQLISAWFYDEKFRRAFVPDPKYFVNENQRILADLMRARGPEWGDGEMYLAEASKHPKLKKSGGHRAISQLIHGTPTAIDPWQSVNLLKVVHYTRELRRALQATLMDPTAGVVLAELQKRVGEALSASIVDGDQNHLSIRDVIEASWDNATKVQERVLFTTGYETIDECTGQFRKRVNYLVGGETGFGKSTSLVFWLKLALDAGRRALLVSSEDPPELYGDRMIATIGKIDATAYRDGKSSPEDLKIIADVRQRYSKYVEPFFIKANGRPVEQVAGEIASFVATENIDIVFCDYLQSFVTARDFKGQRRLEVTHIGKTLFDTVRNAGACGVFYSQLTRMPGQKSPTRDWIRDSKDLINMADAVLIGIYEREEKPPRRLFKVEKVKNGSQGWEVALNFNDRSACFEPDANTARDQQVALTAQEAGDFLAGGPNQVDDFDEWDRDQ